MQHHTSKKVVKKMLLTSLLYFVLILMNEKDNPNSVDYCAFDGAANVQKVGRILQAHYPQTRTTCWAVVNYFWSYWVYHPVKAIILCPVSLFLTHSVEGYPPNITLPTFLLITLVHLAKQLFSSWFVTMKMIYLVPSWAPQEQK
jgi:hypothetical protein